jgi:hypothetical protein
MSRLSSWVLKEIYNIIRNEWSRGHWQYKNNVPVRLKISWNCLFTCSWQESLWLALHSVPSNPQQSESPRGRQRPVQNKNTLDIRQKANIIFMKYRYRKTSLADSDPGSVAFLTPDLGSGICKKSGSGSGIRIRNPDPGWTSSIIFPRV